MSIIQSASSIHNGAAHAGASPVDTILTAEAGHSLHVPGGNFLLTADFHRVGGDLLLVGQDGHQILVQGYFDSHTPPDLIAGTGGVIHPDLAMRLAGDVAAGQYAADGGAAGLHAIGEVQKLAGVVHVRHADGRTEDLHQGSVIYQGDVVETGGDGLVGIVFADRSTFSLGKSGRMVMDELVYDPQSHTGHSSMQVVQGTFSFVSGQIAKSAPDAMTVKTPVMTIGIRGTTVAGRASAEGAQNAVTLLPDADGGVGQIVVTNDAGSVVLSVPNQLIQLSSAFEAPPPPVTLSFEQIQQMIQGVGDAVNFRPPSPANEPHLPSTEQVPPTGADSHSLLMDAPELHETFVPTMTAAPSPLPTTTTTLGAPATLVLHPTTVVSNETVTTYQTVHTTVTQTVHTTDTTTSAGTTATTTADHSSKIIGSGLDFTLLGGSADTQYVESAQGTADIAHANWTIIANGNAATVLTPALSGNDVGTLGTDVLYANTMESPDSTTPVLSTANNGADQTFTLSLANGINVITDAGNTYGKEFTAYGFHSLIGGSSNDEFIYNGGSSMTVNGGAGGYDIVSASHGSTTINLSSTAMTGAAVLTATNVDEIDLGSSENLVILGTQAVSITGGTDDTLSLANESVGATVGMYNDSTKNSTVELSGTISSFKNISVVIGSNHGDIVENYRSYALFVGGTGNDTLTDGYGGHSTLQGGLGNDTLIGGSGAHSVLDGGSGNDLLEVSGASNDTLLGGVGNDTLVADSTGYNLLDGGSGQDILDLSDLSGTSTAILGGSGVGTLLLANATTDSLQNIEVVIGGGDTVVFQGSASNETFIGGATVDYMNYSTATNAVTVNLKTGVATGTDIGTDTLQCIEVVSGGSGNDTFVVGSLAETIDGGGGTNTLDFSSYATAVTAVLGVGSEGTGYARVSSSVSDLLSNIDVVIGSSAGDVLMARDVVPLGWSSNSITYVDALYGGKGSDTIVGSSGNDILDGAGSGFYSANDHDLLYYGNVTAALTMTLENSRSSEGYVHGVASSTDQIANFEVIVGSSLSDTVQILNQSTAALTAVLTLDGGSGDDYLGVDSSSGLTVQASSSGVSITSSAGGSLNLLNFETIASGIGADTLIASGGTHTLFASEFTQNDASALTVATTAALMVKDLGGSTTAQVGQNDLEAISGSGRYVAYDVDGGSGPSVVLYDTENSVALSDMTPNVSTVSTFVMSGDGHKALYSDGGTLYYYDRDTSVDLTYGQQAMISVTATTYKGGAIAMSSDGALVAYVGGPAADHDYIYFLVIASTRTGDVMQTIALDSNNPQSVQFADGGNQVYVLSGSSELLEFHLTNAANSVYSASGTTIESGVSSFHVSANGEDYLYETSKGVYYENGSVTAHLTSETYGMGMSANGRFVAYWLYDSSLPTLMLADMQTGTSVALGTFTSADYSASISLSDSGQYIYFSSSTGVVTEANPYFSASSGDLNTLIGGAGDNTLIGGLAIPATTVLSVTTNGASNPTTSIVAGNTLIGGSGAVDMEGGGGSNDFVLLATNTDHLVISGNGDDSLQVLNLSSTTASMVVDLRSSVVDTSDGTIEVYGSNGQLLGSGTVAGVANIVGGSGAETLIGTESANTIVAGSHSTIIGHGGADKIYFSTGNNEFVVTDDYHAETLYLTNSSSAVNAIAADGEVGLTGIVQSGNDMVLNFANGYGGGSITVSNYYSQTGAVLKTEDGGIFVRTSSASTVLVTAVLDSATVYSAQSEKMLTGSTGGDFIVATSDHMILLGATGALSGATSQGDDFFLNANNEIVIGTSNTEDMVYYTNGHSSGITANLSDLHSMVLTVGGSTLNGKVAEVSSSGGVDYLYKVDGIYGTDNGDTLIGGGFSTSSTVGTDQHFVVGHGTNTIVNVGLLGQTVSGQVMGVYFDSASTAGLSETTGVLVDYSRSDTGITANLADWNVLSYATAQLTSLGETVVMMQTGSVVHDGTTDKLYGVTDIKGSGFNDVITLSLSGSYVQSSKGDDTYYANSASNTLDYGDSSGGVFLNYSGSSITYTWTFSDGVTMTLNLNSTMDSGTSAVLTASALHDYSEGTIYTDVLYVNSSATAVTDIKMSDDGGMLIGTGWRDPEDNNIDDPLITMDLSTLSGGTTINIGAGLHAVDGFQGYGEVSGWNDSASILFANVEVIVGTSSNDTFVLSSQTNPLSLNGSGGTDVVDVGNLGWHYWQGASTFDVSKTTNVLYNQSEDKTYIVNAETVVHEINIENGYTLDLTNLSDHTEMATVYLKKGIIVDGNGDLNSINGVYSGMQDSANSELIGTGYGDLFVGNLSMFTSMLLVDGGDVTSKASLELVDDGTTASLSFSTLSNVHNVEEVAWDYLYFNSITVDATAKTMGLKTLDVLYDGFTNSTLNSSIVLTSGYSANGLTLQLEGVSGELMSLTDSAWSRIQNSSTYGVSDLILGGATLHGINTSTTEINPYSIAVALESTARSAGIRTLDLSGFDGLTSVTLGGYEASTLTVLGGTGKDIYTIDQTAASGRYVIDADSLDLLNLSWLSASSFSYSISSSVWMVSGNSNLSLTLNNLDHVLFSDGEYLISEGSNTIVTADVEYGSTIHTMTTAGLSSFVADTTMGLETYLYGGVTYSLSLGINPGYDTDHPEYGYGDEVIGTATMAGSLSLGYGSHLNMNIGGSGNTHDVLDMGGYGFNSSDSNLKLLADVSTTMSDGTTETLVTNMLSDTGVFAHITGLDSYAAQSIALSLTFTSTSVDLVAHAATASSDATLLGTTGVDYLLGGHGDQTISGGGGADEILAVSGDDTVIVGDNSFRYLDGGSGSSRLEFAFSTKSTIDLTGSGSSTAATTTGGTHRSDSVEHFDELDLTDSHGSTLVLNEDAVYSASNSTNTLLNSLSSADKATVGSGYNQNALIIGGTAGDVLKLVHDSTNSSSSGWTDTGHSVSLTDNGVSHSYEVYTSTIHGVTEHLYVDTHINVLK